MRITNSMMVKNVNNNLYKNLARLDKLNKQLSSGKSINLPSDDPVAVARSLSLRAAVAETEQFRANLADARSGWKQQIRHFWQLRSSTGQRAGCEGSSGT